MYWEFAAFILFVFAFYYLTDILSSYEEINHWAYFYSFMALLLVFTSFYFGEVLIFLLGAAVGSVWVLKM